MRINAKVNPNISGPAVKIHAVGGGGGICAANNPDSNVIPVEAAHDRDPAHP